MARGPRGPRGTKVVVYCLKSSLYPVWVLSANPLLACLGKQHRTVQVHGPLSPTSGDTKEAPGFPLAQPQSLQLLGMEYDNGKLICISLSLFFGSACQITKQALFLLTCLVSVLTFLIPILKTVFIQSKILVPFHNFPDFS